MRIALLSTNMARGGAETQVALLARGFASRGHEVSVLSLVRPSAFAEELGAMLHYTPVWRVPAVLRRLRPEVVHCHMFHANVLGRVLRVAMPFPAVVSTLHSVAESGRGSDRVRARDWMYRLTDGLADATVAVSQAVADRHTSARAARQISVIANGVDVERFRPDAAVRARVRAELGVGEQFVWLAAGRLMWKKNYPALLKAFQNVDGLLLIAGAGPDEMALREMASERVRFLGAREDVPELMAAADAYVLSSVIEGLPMALLEAAACALPCVATDAGGVRETGIGLVVGAEWIEAGMRRLRAMSDEDRAALGAAGRSIVDARFSMDTVVAQWEALYTRLLERSM